LAYICQTNEQQHAMNANEQITSLKGCIAYCNEALQSSELQPWEAKEYSNLLADYVSEVARITEVVAQYHELF
jgi:hypothetical protein